MRHVTQSFASSTDKVQMANSDLHDDVMKNGQFWLQDKIGEWDKAHQELSNKVDHEANPERKLRFMRDRTTAFAILSNLRTIWELRDYLEKAAAGINK